MILRNLFGPVCRMTQGDFDIETLAAYLHVSPTQVERLASRGKLPGRRVKGQWKFSRAEIHHWMEERMGLLDEDELAKVEGVLRRSAARSGEVARSIVSLLPLNAIGIPLAARTRRSVITAMTNLAATTGLLWDPKKMAEAVRAREEMHSTALDIGVALLHPRRPLASILSEPLLALGRTNQGIPFGGEGCLTDIFFLICSTDDRGHLRTLARLSRLIADSSLLEALRAASDAASARQDIARYENALQDDS